MNFATIPGLRTYAKLENLEAAGALYSQPSSQLSIADMEIQPGALVDIESPEFDGTATSNSLVHPSVLHIPEGIAGGYRYIMAVTPFPGGNDAFENPCIYVSNDMMEWVVPDGLTNPIFAKPSGGYNSDVQLYKHTDGYIYLMWRARITGVRNDIFVARSVDGINWSAATTILTAAVAATDWASPSYWHDGTKWVIQAHNIANALYPIIRLEKAGDLMADWTAVSPTTVTITHPSSIRWWHSDVQRLPSGRLIGLAIDYVASGGSFWLWQSDDGINFSVRQLSRSRSYRSCLVLREKDCWMLGVWIDPGGTYTTMQLHQITTGYKERRRARAMAYALSAYSLNVFDEGTSLATHGDGFTGAAANLAAPWNQINGASALRRNGSGFAVAATTADSGGWVETGTIDHSVQAKFNAYSAGEMGLFARYVDPDNYMFVGVVDASGSVGIRYVVATVESTILPTVNPVLSIPTVMRVDMDGAFAHIFIDGKFCIKQQVPAELMAGTKSGLFITGSTANQFDEFFARPT